MRFSDVAPRFAAAWDELPAARGVQADFHDSHAWLAAWCQVAGGRTESVLRIPAVTDGDRPVALLPLEARSRGRWESAGARALATHRKRYRPVLGSEQPDEQVVGLLVEEVGRAGVRELALNRLPARDPATNALLAALRGCGYTLHSRERSSDCLTMTGGDWEVLRRRLAGFERSVKRLVKRCEPWELRLEEYGPRAAAPIAAGFEIYQGLHERSWKGPLGAETRQERLALLRRAEQLGWCSIFVLLVAGVPAAAEIWYRLGQVASVPSTVYDQRLAALGPGSIIAWWAQERIFAESAPQVIDHLPGHNPQKDRLAPDRPPLLIVEAVRRAMVQGASLPLRRHTRSLTRALAARTISRLRRSRPRRPARAPATRLLEVPLGPASLPAARLELDRATRRFLAVTGGHRSPEAMTKTWAPGDGWWRVGEEPAALLRVGAGEPGPGGPGPVPVREVILVAAGPERFEELLGALAAVVEAPLTARLPAGGRSWGRGAPIPVHRALLPWPEAPAPSQAPATKVP